MNIMKYTDLMLDIETGDASVEDVFMQEAYGKIAVASAIFDNEYKISETPEGFGASYVQEAADAGLPATQDGSKSAANAAVAEQLKATYDLILSSARKIKESTNKARKSIMTIGKSYGLSSDTNFIDFAKKLAQLIITDNGASKLIQVKHLPGSKIVQIDGAHFLKGGKASSLAEKFAKGYGAAAAAFGIDLDGVFGDDVVKAYLGKSATTTPGSAETLTDVADLLSTFGTMLASEAKLDKEGSYTSSISAKDLENVFVSTYVICAIATGVAAEFGNSSNKSAAKTAIATVIGKTDAASKKVTKSVAKIGSNAKAWADSAVKYADAVSKGFCDSVYAISGSINR